MQEALFGNLTIDINETENGKYTGPGGSVFFMAKTFENLGVSATIISPRGVDFPKKYLPQTLFVPTGPLFEKTLIFRNKYQGGKREQGVENYAPYLSFDWQKDLRFVAPDSDIVAVAPILNNIDTNQIKAIKDFFPQSFFVLLPQGFYRQIDKSGNIRHGLWGEEGVVVGLFDFISMSEEDLKDADVRGEAWSREGPIVAVTKAERGATLYRNGQRTDYPAFQVAEITDPTGAGDIFAAAFSYAYRKTAHVEEAVDFAQAAAALSLRSAANKLQYSLRDIIEFAKSQERRINLCLH